MKRYVVPCLVLLFLVATGIPVKARTEGIVGSDEDNLRLSLDYSYEQAKFERSNGSTDGDTELKQDYAGIRLETALSDNLQLYVSGGQTMNDFGDSEVEDGTRFGGGIQYVFKKDDNLRYKLFGSYMEHSDENFENATNTSFEVVDDWQAGFMASRQLTPEENFATFNEGYAFMNLLYSGRELERHENNSTTNFEYSDAGGVHITGGVHIVAQEGLSIELEGQAGSTFGGTARVSAKF